MAQRPPRTDDPGASSGPWLRVASLRDLSEGRGLRVRTEGLDIFLVMVDGEVHACDNTCAHQHFSVLHTGEFRGFTVTCPMHGWTYDVRTGRSEGGEGSIASYPVSIRGGEVFVRLG